MNLQIPDCNKFFTVPAENLQNMKETKIIFNFLKKNTGFGCYVASLLYKRWWKCFPFPNELKGFDDI